MSPLIIYWSLMTAYNPEAPLVRPFFNGLPTTDYYISFSYWVSIIPTNRGKVKEDPGNRRGNDPFDTDFAEGHGFSTGNWEVLTDNRFGIRIHVDGHGSRHCERSAAIYRLPPFSVNIPPARIACTSEGCDAGEVCANHFVRPGSPMVKRPDRQGAVLTEVMPLSSSRPVTLEMLFRRFSACLCRQLPPEYFYLLG
jgi:hypothetical protein